MLNISENEPRTPARLSRRGVTRGLLLLRRARRLCRCCFRGWGGRFLCATLSEPRWLVSGCRRCHAWDPRRCRTFDVQQPAQLLSAVSGFSAGEAVAGGGDACSSPLRASDVAPVASARGGGGAARLAPSAEWNSPELGGSGAILAPFMPCTKPSGESISLPSSVVISAHLSTSARDGRSLCAVHSRLTCCS